MHVQAEVICMVCLYAHGENFEYKNKRLTNNLASILINTPRGEDLGTSWRGSEKFISKECCHPNIWLKNCIMHFQGAGCKNLLENISRGANEKHYFWKLQDVLKVFTQNHYLNTEHWKIFGFLSNLPIIICFFIITLPVYKWEKLLSKMLCLGQALVITWLVYYKAMGSLSSHLGACLTLIGAYRNYFGK